MSVQKLVSIEHLFNSFLKSIQLKTTSIRHIDLSCDSIRFQGHLAMLEFLQCVRSQFIFQTLMKLLELQFPFEYYNKN